METGFRRRRPRSPSPGRGDFQPGGPLMRGEWADQIEWLQRQITVLNKTVADHAHVIGQLKTELTQSTVPTIVQRISTLETNVEQRFTDGGNALNRKHETLQAELRVFAAQLQQQTRVPDPPPGMAADTKPDNSAHQHNISTPGRAPIN